MAFKYVVPALAIVGQAAAATCSIASTATTTITNSIQASSFAYCQTFTGNIAIATGASEIALDGVQRIRGSLIAQKASSLNSLSADSLAQIDDTFELLNCPALTSLNFPMLADVGALKWIGLANLQGLSFNAGIQLAEVVNIQNTALGSLEGINLEMVGQITLQNNRALNTIDLALGNISNSLVISANGRDVSLSLPNLIWANDLDIQNASSINIPSLSYVNTSLGFYSNFVDSISAPNLTEVGGTLAIVANGELTNVSMPELKTVVGGFQVANNSNYKQASFPKLATVGGAVAAYGTFSSFALPDLTSVVGGFTLVSTSQITSSCDKFQPLKNSGKIQGQYDCTGQVAHGNTGGNSTSTGTGTSSPSSTSSHSSANTILISSTTGVLGVVAAMFGML